MAGDQEVISAANIVSYQDAPAKVLETLSYGCSRIRMFRDSTEIIVKNSELTILPDSLGGDWEDVIHLELAKRRDRATPEETELSETKYVITSLYRANKISLESACKIFGCKKSNFYRLLKKNYDEVGSVALIRDVRGRKKGTRMLCPKLESIISGAISKQYKGKATSFAAVYREVTDRCAESGLAPPSRTTVVYRIKQIPVKTLYRLKNGSEAAEEKYGAKPSRLVTKRALQVFQMDHTPVDLIICDIKRQPIGRPWLTLVMDVHTRVIVGYYIALHPPSTISVACAITVSIMPKNDFIKSVGCGDLLYPFHGKPEAIHLDNAAEFKSLAFQKACANHNIKLVWRPLGKKHYGGHIERLIGTMMNGHVHFLPGTTYSNTQQRKGYDSEKHSALTLKEFGEWFAREVVIYNGARHSALGKSPGDAWGESVNEQVQKIYSGSEIFRLRLDFMPEATRCISPKGILFNRQYYYSPALCQHVGLKNIAIKYDPYSLKKIWVKLDGAYIEVPYADVTANDIAFEEYYAERIIRSSSVVSTWMSPVHVAGMRRDNEALVNSALKEKKRTRKSIASAQEYKDYTKSTFPDPNEREDAGCPKIDYNEKPTPFRSDD